MASIIHLNFCIHTHTHTHIPLISSENAEIKIKRSQMWQLTPEIPALGKLKPDEC